MGKENNSELFKVNWVRRSPPPSVGRTDAEGGTGFQRWEGQELVTVEAQPGADSEFLAECRSWDRGPQPERKGSLMLFVM